MELIEVQTGTYFGEDDILDMMMSILEDRVQKDKNKITVNYHFSLCYFYFMSYSIKYLTDFKFQI